jgi:hypothetical protein
LELAALAALAGVFAVAQAADLNPRWNVPHLALGWVTPAGGVLVFASLAIALLQWDRTGIARTLAIAVAGAGAVTSIASAWRPVATWLAQWLFRARQASRTTRLAARMVSIGLFFCVPGHFAFVALTESNTLPSGSLIGLGSLWSGLIGLTLLALGGVGFLVRRDLRATLDRLGLQPLRAPHLAVILIGVIGLFGLNAGAESLERAFFPEAWASDQRVNQLMVGELSRYETLVLGLSAGVGEELALRGALQPIFGLVPTSLVFAALHVQYSWLGMGVILLLGLTLGWIRQRTSTTTAIAVHALYDIVAVFTMGPPAG